LSNIVSDTTIAASLMIKLEASFGDGKMFLVQATGLTIGLLSAKKGEGPHFFSLMFQPFHL
jgi:hypothetical protein